MQHIKTKPVVHDPEEEASVLRAHLVVTVCYRLIANDDQGASEPPRTQTHKRRLHPDAMVTNQMVTNAVDHAAAITTSTVAFEHDNAYRCHITSTIVKVEYELN